MVECPVCGLDTTQTAINAHLDNGCPPIKKVKLEPNTFDLMKNAQRKAESPAAQNSKHGVKQTSASPVPEKSLQLSPQTGSPEFQGTQPCVPSSDDPFTSPIISSKANDTGVPLAERIRPKTLDEYIGQQELLGPNGPLRKLLETDQVPSIILWGPCGVGKTSFARILAKHTKSRFVELSATSASTNDVKKLGAEAIRDLRLINRRTILFLDEIHRFNRTQQDSLLPFVEKGLMVLVGATTENPSFKLQGALLSRCRVLRLQPLSEPETEQLIQRALNWQSESLSSKIIRQIADSAGGDGRAAINMVEVVLNIDPDSRNLDEVKRVLHYVTIYDQKGDMHHDLISAFHKAVRGSDVNATLYYLARMLKGGEDPLYVSRRMIRMASEDIGVADNECLLMATAAHTAVQQIGMPECDVILAHTAVRMARAKKDVSVYRAWGYVCKDLEENPSVACAPVPLHLRNATTKLTKDYGYADGYKYNPDYEGEVVQEYLPPNVDGGWMEYFTPDMLKRDC